MQANNLGQLTQELLSAEVPRDSDNLEALLKACGWKRTGAAVLVASIWKKAVAGDVNSAKLIREMNGEAVPVYGERSDYSSLTDEELRMMIEGQDDEKPAADVPKAEKRDAEEYVIPW